MSETQAPSVDEIKAMTPEEGMVAGAAADGVTIVHRRERHPVAGTKAEKRQERMISFLFLLAALAGVGFVVVFCAVPFHYQLPGTSQSYIYFTPLLGGLLALMLVCIGFGAVLWAKWLMPEEEAVQDRHADPSTDEDKLLTTATLSSGLSDTGLPRRSMLRRTLLLAGGAVATVPLVALVGAMIKKPGDQLHHTAYKQDPADYPNGVPIIFSDGRRIGPDDLEPGGLATVFPGVPGAIHLASSPTLIIRLRSGQRVNARKGQENDNFGDYVAYSKICTHAGCPASLYEQQTTRLLCPCHQSQFEVLQDAKPVFGPATRPLPRLPLGVEVIDGRQYFVAKGDFREPIGPGYWERKA